MKYRKLENCNYHEIKQAILDPDSTPLSEAQQEILERLVSAAKILDRYPSLKNAAKILQTKFSGLSRAQAYRDLRDASRLFNSYQEFDFDFWTEWLLKDIVEQINSAKDRGDLYAWNRGHIALIKVIGKRPEPELDPKLVEKHTFVIQGDWNNRPVYVNLDFLHKIPKREREKLVAELIIEIDDEQAKEIMNS